MAQPKAPLRVGLLQMLNTDNAYELVSGILEYKRNVTHWKLVGDGGIPFVNASGLDAGSVDGVIGNFYEGPWAKAVAQAGVTAVNMSNAIAELDLPRVGADDEAVGRMGAEYLLQLGFAHFGYIDRPGVWFSQRRLASFREVIEGAGHACHVTTDSWQPVNVGTDDLGRWIEALPKPIGILASSDHMGRRAIVVAETMGVRVPDDVAVLGVDNDRWTTQMWDTTLSSIQLDSRQVGYQAAKLLDALMSGEMPPPPRWVPPLGVVGRRSTDITLSQDPLVTEALSFIRDHCVREELTVEDVLEDLGISRRNLELRMKQATGQTPNVAITRARIARAEKMLIETESTMAQIAAACGFRRQGRFSAVFKQVTGTTPGAYRRQRTRSSSES